MNEENRTLIALNEYRNLIKQIREADNEGDGFAKMELLTKLSETIDNDSEDKIIPEKIVEINYDSDATVDDMENYINQIEDAYEQVNKSLDWNTADFKDSGDNKDSKDVLQDIKNLMDTYMGTYSKNEGMMSAVEEFSAIGNAIKHALEEKKISTTTALLLTEPLNHMKDHMFDSNRQEEEAAIFYDILNKRLSREDEKEGPEQSKEGQEQAREGVLSSAGTVLGRTVEFAIKAIKKINEKIEEGAQRAADEYDKEQAIHAQQAQGAVPTEELAKQQRKEDVSQESEETLKHEDAAQKQQGPKTKEEALANLREALDKYNEDRNDLDKWRKYWAALHEPILKDFTEKYFENGEKLQKSGAGEDALYKQAVEMIDKELGHDIKQESKQQMQGAVPGKELGKKQEQKDLAPEMKRDTGAKEQQHEPQTKAEALQKLKDLYAKRYDARLNSSANQANTNIDFFAEMENNPMLKDVAKKYFDLYGQSKAGGVRRDGWFAYKAKEMINNELAKELGQEIQPEDKKISALLDVLYMSDSLQIDKVADSEAYDRMKSALQKLADDKVISPEIMRDYQAIFDAEGRPHLTGAQVMHLENAILGQLDKLESENEKQRQNGKGKIVEPQQNVKEDPTQAQVKPEELIKAAEQQEKVDKKETILPGVQDKPRESELANKMQNKDVSPKPEELMQREDLKQEKEPSEDMTAKKQEVLKKIENSIMVYDNMFSNDFGEATHELDALTKYINQSVKEGLISHRDGAQYRKMIEGVYGQTDWRVASDGIEKILELNDKQKEMLESKGVKDEPKDLKQKPVQEKSTEETNKEQDIKTQRAQKEEHKPEDLIKREEIQRDKDNEKKQETKDLSQKPENLMKREEAQKDKLNEKKPEDRDLSQTPKNLLNREDAEKGKLKEKKMEKKDLSQESEALLNREEQQKKDENKHKTENFEKGNQKVIEMDNKRDAQKKTLNQQALAAYRRKVLQGRSNAGNV